MKNILKGKEGEKVALDYLIKKGYHLLAQNYRYKRGEIDLVLRKENTLVFVEVKLRTGIGFGFPENTVDEKKETLIVATAEAFLEKEQLDLSIRFDIVSIIKKGNNYSIEHFEDAFY